MRSLVAHVIVVGWMTLHPELACSHHDSSPTDVMLRELDWERAVLMFKWEITLDAGRAATPFRGNAVLLVAKARDGWAIVAGRAAAGPASK